MTVDDLRELRSAIDQMMVPKRIGTLEDPFFVVLPTPFFEAVIREGFITGRSGKYFYEDPIHGVVRAIKQDKLPKP